MVFGGTQGKSFRADTVVLDARAPSDVKRARWFRPTPAATGGPGPRAFHSAVAVGTDLYVLCGRTGREQHGDVWVLDTTTWRWSALADRFPSAKRVGVTPRDFGVAARVPNGNNVLLFGGFDGHGWLNDLHVLDVATGEWRAVAVPVAPSPRSGHAGDVVYSRVLLFGGQASNGQLCGDLWALRDPDTDPIARDADALVDILDGRGDASSPPTGADGRRSAEADADASAARDASAEESSREPRWTRLHLRGQPPGPRTGHSVTCVGNKVLVFGGRGDDGWLVKQHVYYDDAHVVDRELGKWRRLERVAGSNQRPPPRAFHTMTKVGDAPCSSAASGETALGDAWWCEFGEEDAAAETGAAAAAERLKHPGAAAHPRPGPRRLCSGARPRAFPRGRAQRRGERRGGVGRLLMSGLGVVGTAARGGGRRRRAPPTPLRRGERASGSNAPRSLPAGTSLPANDGFEKSICAFRYCARWSAKARRTRRPPTSARRAADSSSRRATPGTCGSATCGTRSRRTAARSPRKVWGCPRACRG